MKVGGAIEETERADNGDIIANCENLLCGSRSLQLKKTGEAVRLTGLLFQRAD